jgi:hypothetical protein
MTPTEIDSESSAHLTRCHQHGGMESQSPATSRAFHSKNAVKGKTKIPDQKWKDLLDHFDQPQFVLMTDNFEFPDLLGAAYEYLIKFFADSAGKEGGEFYTPAEVVRAGAAREARCSRRISGDSSMLFEARWTESSFRRRSFSNSHSPAKNAIRRQRHADGRAFRSGALGRDVPV